MKNHQKQPNIFLEKMQTSIVQRLFDLSKRIRKCQSLEDFYHIKGLLFEELDVETDLLKELTFMYNERSGELSAQSSFVQTLKSQLNNVNKQIDILNEETL